MLLKVTVNGQVFHVDAPNRATAKAFGKKQLDVKVEELGVADLAGLDHSTILKVEAAEKTEPVAAGAEAETAAAE